MTDVSVAIGGQLWHGLIPRTDAYGVRSAFTDLIGWWDGVGSTGKAEQNAFDDGAWIDEAYDQARTIIVQGSLWAESSAQARDAIARVKAAIPTNGLVPFVVSDDGLVSYARVRKDGQPTFKRVSPDTVRFSIQLVAPDPRRFSGDGSSPFTYSASTGLPTSTGGLQLGTQAPFQVRATTVSGSVTVTNAGDATPPVRVTITGPVVNPVIRSAAGGLMQFNISLDAGQTLVVDLDKRTVKINGTVNRRNVLAGSWIVPAAGTVLSFDASSYNSSAQMSVQWSDAWS